MSMIRAIAAIITSNDNNPETTVDRVRNGACELAFAEVTEAEANDRLAANGVRTTEMAALLALEGTYQAFLFQLRAASPRHHELAADYLTRLSAETRKAGKAAA